MLLSFYGVLTLFYVVFVFILQKGWRGWPQIEDAVEPSLFVTVIIVVRNEENYIEKLLKDLERQDYPGESFEVLIIDDESQDKTYDVIDKFSTKSDLDLSLFQLMTRRSSPKKEAITFGVSQAKGELIMVTDGDCRVGRSWISTFARHVENKKSKFISGPVTFEQDKKFFTKFQTIEFSSLIGSGAAVLYYKQPVMCNGANLGFSKKVFQELNGFEGNENLVSGDDIFLMRKIFKGYPGDVRFLKNKEAIVHTYPENTVLGFLNQRIRWAGKWKYVGGWVNRLLPIAIFAFHFMTLFLYIKLILNQINVPAFLAILFLKFLAEYFFLKDVMKFLSKKSGIFIYMFSSLIYPFYAVYVGMAANFAGYTWKGRKYK